MNEEPRIRLGVLTQPFGLAGGMRCALDGDMVPTIATPCDAWIGFSDSFTRQVRLERTEARPGEVICHFAGIATREDAALQFGDRALFLPSGALGYGSEYAHPILVGYEVRNEAGESLGTIGGIFRTPAHLIWQIAGTDGEWLLPAIEEFVAEVRHSERVAIVRPIPGMMAGDPDEHDEG
ncbi:MAG: 16S rRNA processing protein RimM [Bacteroidetes bacterium]|nr:16S rRNA processing protein RimM [Bacteroidota bacterium]